MMTFSVPNLFFATFLVKVAPKAQTLRVRFARKVPRVCFIIFYREKR
jgi:hypothetical protein